MMINETLGNKIYVCGIGAQKSGTTFLANYLAKHPDFFMSPLKELHYFNTQFNSKYNGNFEKKLSLNINALISKFNNGENINVTLLSALIKRIEAARKNNYKSYFKYFVQDHHIAFGEITPAYSMLNRDGYQKIIKMFPNHKFIFLLRNPVDRFWSQLNYELRSNNSDIDPLSLIDQKLNDEAYTLRSDYKRTIEELLKVVDRENIFIEFYENIFSDKGSTVIERLSMFLSIEYREDLLTLDKKVNTTLYKSEINKEHRIKIVKKFQEIYEYIIKEFEVPDNWKDDYSLVNPVI